MNAQKSNSKLEKIKVGIIFGGPSREREISFAGGRTVYDNLDKRLFEPVPLFLTAEKKLIQLDWSFIYKGTIRDFWPPVEFYPNSTSPFQLSEESLQFDRNEKLFNKAANQIGTLVQLDELRSKIDVAFLVLHGSTGEDGSIQGTLEYLNIPYTGSGIVGSSIGMDKQLQKTLMKGLGFETPSAISISKEEWLSKTTSQKDELFTKTIDSIGKPIVVRGANQGSSIGVSILKTPTPQSLSDAIDLSFFKKDINIPQYQILSEEEKVAFVANLTDLRHGIGFPMKIGQEVIYTPTELQNILNQAQGETITIEGLHSESEVILESFLNGTEVSTIVIQDESGEPFALLPTEIIKGGEVFDYRSKYLPGLSRKNTPANLPNEYLNKVRKEAERLFKCFKLNTFARIDGFVSPTGKVTLNDPNTTSGMLPSSFFFHQAAEIGLSPSSFLTYILYQSLQERTKYCNTPNGIHKLLVRFNTKLDFISASKDTRSNVAIFLGGYSSERHISVESGRNIFEKLSSSEKYKPTAFFVDGNDQKHELYQLPINLLLKDNADDIKKAINSPKEVHQITEAVRKKAQWISKKFSGKTPDYKPSKIEYKDLTKVYDAVFIALHGRPGEDGQVQKRLDEIGLPYNGSGFESSQITIDKYKTLQTLKANGFVVTNQLLVNKTDFITDFSTSINEIENEIGYPLIAKPNDDGCSSAVIKIDNQLQLKAYLNLLFSVGEQNPSTLREILGIHSKDEIPEKDVILIEKFISQGDCVKFMEITGGLITTRNPNGEIDYLAFEPSEALSTGKVLTLEEKFLAGEGQNITPARFSHKNIPYSQIAEQVKKTLENAARILKVEGYARIDAFVKIYPDGKADTIVIEINSLPGMTPATCIYHQAAIANLTPYQFIDKILTYGVQKRMQLNKVD